MTKTVLIAEKFQNGARLSGYVAEIGACMLGVQIGVAPEFDQSASYVEGWLAAMKGDNRAIFRAASEAQKAVDFILGEAGRATEQAA
ncbi:zincin-like metallopeptidase domain-containing protein [Salipiger thiooxidans]|uniref:zincin-like metallopeptidase domain-containing protein n=1 Tax=Salipiger thiooxidans TaxID=282683 RepID=UPI001CF94686|nr:zincin-like metallopeptidase domain-containing protein [Salipiger thiooxidans]